MSYMHFVFWKEKEERPLEKIRAVAASMYSEKIGKTVNIRESEDRLVLAFEDFQFTFVFIDENWVQEESRDIADTFGKNRKDHSIIRDSKSRIEFYGTDDPNMDYFNDYLLILEKIQRELPVIIFDTEQGIFFDEI